MIGTGYVGLVSGVCFSDFGHQVVCVDKSAEKLAKLQAGQVPIYEPGLDVATARNVPALVGARATVGVVDPQGRREGETPLPGVQWQDDPYAVAEGAEAIIILAEWNEFRALDMNRLAAAMSSPKMADLRNIYGREDVLAAGFVAYEGVGR